MGKNRVPKEESNASLSKRKENIVIPFENENELIKLVAEHLAYKYKKTFLDLKEKDKEEYKRRCEEVQKFKEALTKLLKLRMKLFKETTITRNSLILKIAFRMAKIKQSPKDSFRPDIIHKIRGLEFQIIKEHECS